MSKTYTLKDIFSEEQLVQIKKTATTVNSTETLVKELSDYFSSLNVQERGFDTEQLANVIAQKFNALYETA